jgi:hypothetical protein
MEFKDRKSVFENLKGYCYLSGDNDYIEVTEFSNGEGFNIEINRRNSIDKFSLTFGEFQLLQVLINVKKPE